MAQNTQLTSLRAYLTGLWWQHGYLPPWEPINSFLLRARMQRLVKLAYAHPTQLRYRPVWWLIGLAKP